MESELFVFDIPYHLLYFNGHFGKSKVLLSPYDIQQNVLKPTYDQIIHYLESILQGVTGDSIEALVLTGGLCDWVLLLELVKDVCKAAGVKVVYLPERRRSPPSSYNDVISGAIYKAMDTIIPRAEMCKLLLDQIDSPMNSFDSEQPTFFVFIGNFLFKL